MVDKLHEQIALRMFELRQILYSDARREHRISLPGEFPRLNHAFYEQCQGEFEKLGFRLLGELEIVALTRVGPNQRTFVRCMISADGTVLMGARNYQQTLDGVPCDIRMVELETEFSNGDFLTTVNRDKAGPSLIFPKIEMIDLPSSTNPAGLLAAHANRVNETLLASPGLRANQINGMEDCLASQQRMNVIRASHMRGIGYFTDDELQLLRQRKPRVRWQAVAMELERLRKAELSGSAAVTVSKTSNEP